MTMPRLAPYYKSVVAGVGEIVTAATAITTLLALVPSSHHGVAVGMSTLLAVLGVAKTTQVYLVKNEPLVTQLDSAVRDAGALIEQARHRKPPNGDGD